MAMAREVGADGVKGGVVPIRHDVGARGSGAEHRQGD